MKMSNVTYFKSLHVYNLRKALGPSLQYALIITSDKYVSRPEHQIVSVLLLSDRPKNSASYIRVHIKSIGSGGKAHMAMDYYGQVDNIMPMPKSNLMVTSCKPITDSEERDVQVKLKEWLDL